MKLIVRDRLLRAILDDSRHVLIIAPTGFGKSVLLEQAAEAAGEQAVLHRAGPGDDLIHLLTVGTPETGRLCFVDDAHLLDAGVVSTLLRHPATERRFVLAVRHQHYPRVVTLWQQRRVKFLTTADLNLTREEVASLHPSVRAEGVMSRTLGWPALVSVETLPLAQPSDYLGDLLDDLPPVWRARLLDLWVSEGSAGQDGAAVLDVLGREGGLLDVLNAGFPVVGVNAELRVHPAMARHLTELTAAQGVVVRLTDETLENYRDVFPTLSPAHRLLLLERYFEQHGEDDHDLELKVELLSQVELRDLSPWLRDLLASYLLTAGRVTEAQYALMMQQDMGQDSTYTHVLFGRVANHRSDFVAFEEHLRMARERAQTDTDHARVEGSETGYLMRLNRYDEALVSNAKYYKYAVRSGRMDLLISALAQGAYVQYFAGQLERALDTAREALSIAEQDSGRFVPQLTHVLYHIAEISKDTGQHAQAMELVQRGLNLHAKSSNNSVPYLYNTRGLVYLELGDWTRAVESFEAAIASFRERDNAAGLLMPHTYAAYACYLLGHHEDLFAHVRALREVVGRVGAGQHEYEEHLAYQPLAEGLALLAAGEPAQALDALGEILTRGTLGYDSVLLARLEDVRIRTMLGTLREEDALRLVEVLDARHEDVTARMYVNRYSEAYRAIAALGVQRERFVRLADAQVERAVASPEYVLRVRTLGRVGLEANGVALTLRSLFPLYVLTYLHLQRDWKTTDALGSELFSFKGDPRNTAFKSVSELRRLLTELDRELEPLLSPTRHPSGYRLMTLPGVRVETDVDVYLTDAFTPGGAAVEVQTALLRDLSTFMSKLDSTFTQRVNAELTERALVLARELGLAHMHAEAWVSAARVLLYGVRLTMDSALAQLLVRVSMRVPEVLAETLRQVVRNVEGDVEESLPDVVADALAVLARVEVDVEGGRKEPQLV